MTPHSRIEDRILKLLYNYDHNVIGIDEFVSAIHSLYNDRVDELIPDMKLYGYTLSELKRIINFAKSRNFTP